MNCKYHSYSPAVSNCQSCKVGLCVECHNNSIYKVDNQKVCIICHKEIIDADIENVKYSIKMLYFKTVVIIIVVLIVAYNVLIKKENVADVHNILILSIGGLPSTWNYFSQTDLDKVQESVASTKSAMVPMINLGVRMFFRVITGAIASPILLFVNFYSINKKKRSLEQLLIDSDVSLKIIEEHNKV